MVKRSMFGVVVLAVLGALTGCINPPAPPQPTVHSVEVSPQPAHPGDTVSIRIDASHSYPLYNGRALLMVNPQGSEVDVDICDATIEHPDEEDQTHGTVTIACELPELVSNGTWTLGYRLNYSPPSPADAPIPLKTVTFEVAGGSDDVSPPTLVSYEISPDVVTRTAPFTVTAVVRDDSPPMALGFWNRPNTLNIQFRNSDYSKTCHGGTMTPISADEAEVVFHCTAGWIGTVGPLTGQISGDLYVRDALYNNGAIPLTIDLGSGA